MISVSSMDMDVGDDLIDLMILGWDWISTNDLRLLYMDGRVSLRSGFAQLQLDLLRLSATGPAPPPDRAGSPGAAVTAVKPWGGGPLLLPRRCWAAVTTPLLPPRRRCRAARRDSRVRPRRPCCPENRAAAAGPRSAVTRPSAGASLCRVCPPLYRRCGRRDTRRRCCSRESRTGLAHVLRLSGAQRHHGVGDRTAPALMPCSTARGVSFLQQTRSDKQLSPAAVAGRGPVEDDLSVAAGSVRVDKVPLGAGVSSLLT